MAARKDIEAGRAKVTLWADASALASGLRKVQQQMQSLGSGIMKIGAAFAGLGAAITAPLAGAVMHFSTAGDALDKMSMRTGVAVSALAELGYAAGMGGSNIEDVEKSIKKMQKTLFDASNGSKAAQESIERLGLDLKQLQGMAPEDQFAAIAEKIAAIQDPTQRAGAAMAVFGKAGTMILPMLQGLEAVKQEARDLGLVPSTESTKMAAAINDAMGKVQSVVSATYYEIGAALAPVLIPAIEAVAKMASAVIFWVRENQQLIQTIAAIGAGLIVAGTAITAVGAVIFGLGSVVGAAVTLMTTLGAVFAAIISPLGLIVIAIGGAVAAFLTLTEVGRETTAFISEAFIGMGQTIRDVLGVAVDALMAGDLEAAARALWLGLQIVWHENTQSLNEYWLGAKMYFLEIWSGATNALAGFFIDAYATIRSGWAEVAAFVAQVWDSVTGGDQALEIETKRQEAQKQIEDERSQSRGAFDEDYQRELDQLQAGYEEGINAKREALNEARAELAAIRQGIEGKRKAIEDPNFDEKYRPGGPDMPPEAEFKSTVLGTFSASAAAAIGQGPGKRQEQLLGAIRQGQQAQLEEAKRLREKVGEQMVFA